MQSKFTMLKSGVVYKYTPSKYAKLILDKGCVRVRPLQFYRAEEDLGRFIGDKMEGTSTSSMYFEEVSTADHLHPNEQSFLKDHNIIIENSVGTTVKSAIRTSEDLYIYCVSDSLSRSLAREFCGQERVGIVMIWDIYEFYMAVSRAIEEYAEPLGYAKVVYVHGEFDYRIYGSIHPSLIKNAAFESQSEVRMAWRPKGPIREHIDACSPSIARFCADGDFAILR